MELSRSHTVIELRKAESKYVTNVKENAHERVFSITWLNSVMDDKCKDLQAYLSAVNYFDRCQTLIRNQQSDVQIEIDASLLRTGCAFVAAKNFQTDSPTVEDLTEWSGHSADAILSSERKVCRLLDMNLMFPSPIYFLEHVVSMLHETATVREMSLVIIELFTFVHSGSSLLPSAIAACSLYIARLHYGCGTWSSFHVALCGYASTHLNPCMKALKSLHPNHIPERYQNIYQAVNQQLLR